MFFDEVSDLIARRGPSRRESSSQRGADNSVNQGVDPEILEFVQKYLTSYTKWEVLKYFAENPSTTETSRSFARRLGKDARQIGEAMKSLARTGIIGDSRNGDGEGYALTASDSQRAVLQRIADSARLNNRFRLLLNYHITKASLAKYKSERSY